MKRRRMLCYERALFLDGNVLEKTECTQLVTQSTRELLPLFGRVTVTTAVLPANSSPPITNPNSKRVRVICGTSCIVPWQPVLIPGDPATAAIYQ